MGNHACEAFVGKPAGKQLRTRGEISPLADWKFFPEMI